MLAFAIESKMSLPGWLICARRRRESRRLVINPRASSKPSADQTFENAGGRTYVRHARIAGSTLMPVTVTREGSATC